MKRNILLLVLSSCAALSLTNCNNGDSSTTTSNPISENVTESLSTEIPS